jgi:hypothetical protein
MQNRLKMESGKSSVAILPYRYDHEISDVSALNPALSPEERVITFTVLETSRSPSPSPIQFRLQTDTQNPGYHPDQRAANNSPSPGGEGRGGHGA